MKARQGFTLIELMISLAALAIVGGAAIPAMQNGMEAARAGDARGALMASMMTAAGQASVTGVRGVLCPSEDGVNCIDSPDWSEGWLVFLDTNGSRDVEGGEPILRKQGKLAGKVHLRSTVGRTRIVFQGNGGNLGSNVTFTLCDGRGPRRARSLVLANLGGMRESDPTPEAAAATCRP